MWMLCMVYVKIIDKGINFGSVIANIALITKKVLRSETINWDKLSFFGGPRLEQVYAWVLCFNQSVTRGGVLVWVLNFSVSVHVHV